MGAPLCPMRAGGGPRMPSSLIQGEYMPRGTRYRVKRTARYSPRMATCRPADRITAREEQPRASQNTQARPFSKYVRCRCTKSGATKAQIRRSSVTFL